MKEEWKWKRMGEKEIKLWERKKVEEERVKGNKNGRGIKSAKEKEKEESVEKEEWTKKRERKKENGREERKKKTTTTTEGRGV